jgi:1-deoxy-D-xylulose-5-phosphate synthase
VVLDRAGITGEDGPSHHGMWDLSLLQAVPGLRVAAPRDAETVRTSLADAVAHAGPTVLRMPKATEPFRLPAVGTERTVDLLRTGHDVLLVAIGAMAAPALAAAARLDGVGTSAAVCHPRWITPIPSELVAIAAGYSLVVTVEDGSRVGGFGSAYRQELADAGVDVPHLAIGIPRRFIDHGQRAGLLAEVGLDESGIAEAVTARLRELRHAPGRR